MATIQEIPKPPRGRPPAPGSPAYSDYMARKAAWDAYNKSNPASSAPVRRATLAPVGGSNHRLTATAAPLAKYDASGIKENPLTASLTDEQILNSCKKRFAMLSDLAVACANSTIRSVVVIGPGGIGKSFNVEKKLEELAASGTLSETLSGDITAPVLYQALYRKREKGNVILIDDGDSVFTDESSLTLLKAALNSPIDRPMQWPKMSRWLEDLNIPSKFIYRGSIIFITNINLRLEAQKGSRLARHMEAFLTRPLVLDMQINDRRSMALWVKYITERTNMIVHNSGVSKAVEKELLAWVLANRDKLIDLSLRTMINLGRVWNLAEAGGNPWMEHAEEMMFLPQYRGVAAA
jgi:hypothetical protein